MSPYPQNISQLDITRLFLYSVEFVQMAKGRRTAELRRKNISQRCSSAKCQANIMDTVMGLGGKRHCYTLSLFKGLSSISFPFGDVFEKLVPILGLGIPYTLSLGAAKGMYSQMRTNESVSISYCGNLQSC